MSRSLMLLTGLLLISAVLVRPILADEEGPLVPLTEIETYSAGDYSSAMTDCDRLAAHPSDPNAIGEGVSRAEMDKSAAILACEEAVAADPENPRLNYQLARAYGYSGMHEAAMPYRATALRAGYPQSLFVMGYILVTGWDGNQADPCYGGELIRRSAQAGRYAGLIGFPYYAVKGTFRACAGFTVEAAELQAMLDRAAGTPDSRDYYQGLLIDLLRDRVGAEFP